LEDFYQPDTPLEYTYRELNILRLVDKSRRNDTSLSCLYNFKTVIRREKYVQDIKLELPWFPETVFPQD